MTTESEDLRRELLQLLAQTSFEFDMTKPFTLASGEQSSYYIYGKKYLSFPLVRKRLVSYLALEWCDLLVNKYAVGGMELGAYPFALCISDASWNVLGVDEGLRAFCIRKARKNHGIQSRFAGVNPVCLANHGSPSSSVLVVEDVTTTGQTLLEAITVCRDAQIPVRDALTLVDRSNGAAGLLVATQGVVLNTIFTLDELLHYYKL